MAGTFERHDKIASETIAISLGIDDNSRLRHRMTACFDHFVDARLMHAKDIAKLMRDAWKWTWRSIWPASPPIPHRCVCLSPRACAVNYLGYPGTMGVLYGLHHLQTAS